MPTDTEILSLSGKALDRLVEKHLWGDDLTAKTPELCHVATLQVIRESDCDGTPDWFVLGEYPTYVNSLWASVASQIIWDNRHGKPYQSALESHVAAYRADPPHRDVLEIVERARGMGVFVRLCPTLAGYNVDAWDRVERLDFVVCSAEEMPVVVKRLAVYAAMRIKESSERVS